MIKKCEICEIIYKYCDRFLEYKNFKDDLTKQKRLCCNKNYQHKVDEKSKERFFNTYKFSNHDNDKFLLLLRKGVYLYECIDDQEKFNETSLRGKKKDFYSQLNMGDITDADYASAKRIRKNRRIAEYHDLYVQSDTLLLVDVTLEICVLEYMNLILLKISFCSQISMESSFKKRLK